MNKICISKCVSDARIPVRASYGNLYKWPESDAEFMKSAGMHGGARPRSSSRVAESISCRQIYLRSYKFSRKESVTIKCFGKVRSIGRRRRRRLAGRVKDFSRAALFAIFRRLLFCASTVDVVDATV